MNKYHFLTDDEKIRAETNLLVEKARHFYDNLHDFRVQRTRMRKFVFGDQWSDTMEDPDNEGQTITEKQYLVRSGRFPAINNQMGTMLRNLVGQYRQNKSESIIQSRQRGKQEAAEMLTSALKYVLDLNRISAVDANQVREFIISGAFGWKVEFQWWKTLNMNEIKIDPIDQTRLLHNNVQDPRLFDLNFIGYLHDLSFQEMVSLYCNSKKDEKKLKESYAEGREHDFDETSGSITDEAETRDFYMESDLSKFRVIEIWTLKYEWVQVLHDPKEGTYEIFNGDDFEFEMLTEKRRMEAEILGIPEEKYLPTLEKTYDARYWCYHLTPYGHVLFASPTPYWHEETPFVFMKYPLIDGVTRPLMADIIDQQKHINRNISIIDFMISVGAKGVLMVPKDQIPEKMSPKEFAKKWRSFDDVIVYEPKAGMPKPEQINANSIPVGVIQMLNTQLELMDKISGLNGAMQGQAPSSATPASLYAQQTMNAGLNNRDLFDVFNEGLKTRNKKVAQLIQQYWAEPRYLNVKSYTGYKEVDYDPDQVIDFDFDLVINETTATGMYRAMMDDMLNQWVMSGLIQLEDMLSMTSLPFADTLMEKIKQRQQQIPQGMPQGMPQNVRPIQQAV